MYEAFKNSKAEPMRHTATVKPGQARSLLCFSKRAVIDQSVAVAIGLTLLGYTVLLMVYSNVIGGTDGSRILTIPIRLLIVGFLVVAFLMSGRINRHPAVLWFLVFAGLYLLRVFMELFMPDPNLYQPPLQFLLYFVSFTALPFLLLSSLHFDMQLAERIRRFLMLLAAIFTIFTVLFYGSYIGQVGRISSAVDRYGAYISPLALSYQSALIIGIVTVHWASKRTTVLQTFGAFGLITISAVPFFLGASRGSLVALGLVALFFVSFWPDVKRRAYFVVGAVCIVLLAVVLQEYLGKGVFNRMANIAYQIETGSSSALRLMIWREGIDQFLSAPLFGNSLQHEGFRFHPHNMFVEVLIATGLLGIVPFSLFLLFVVKEAIRVVRKSPERSWVVVVFFVGFALNLFSGSISTAVMMSTGGGLILATSRCHPLKEATEK